MEGVRLLSLCVEGVRLLSMEGARQLSMKVARLLTLLNDDLSGVPVDGEHGVKYVTETEER